MVTLERGLEILESWTVLSFLNRGIYELTHEVPGSNCWAPPAAAICSGGRKYDAAAPGVPRKPPLAVKLAAEKRKI